MPKDDFFNIDFEFANLHLRVSRFSRFNTYFTIYNGSTEVGTINVRSQNHLELIVYKEGRVPILSSFIRNDNKYLMIHSGREEVGLVKMSSRLTGVQVGLTYNTDIEFIYYLLLAVTSAFHYTVIRKADMESELNY